MWELDCEESWVPKNCCFWTVVLEKTLESPLDSKEIQLVHPKGNQSWIFIGRTDAEAETPLLWPPDVKELTHLKRPWCWERLKVGGERDNRGWDGWMASLTRWTWVWASSRSWCWTGKPGVLQSMGTQRVWHDWVTERNRIFDLAPSLAQCPAQRKCSVNPWHAPVQESLVDDWGGMASLPFWSGQNLKVHPKSFKLGWHLTTKLTLAKCKIV